ncbi:MAG: hypothetical protein OEV40_18505, partial [Acidimicrobiia bacterium]|nr:hypothetical protein [Acidimicrobiia bacterium]
IMTMWVMTTWVMTRRRSGVVGLLLALPILVLAGCGSFADPTSSELPDASTGEAGAPRLASSTGSSGGATRPSTAAQLTTEAETASTADASAADASSPDASIAGATPSPVDGLVAGTDSSTPADAVPPAAALHARLVEFGRLYLAFDYRADPGTRLAELRSLVAPGLLDQLAQPMPPALREFVEAEERIVEPEFIELTPLASDVFQLSFTVATSAAGDRTEEHRRLIVTVDGAQLVSDVR